MTVEALRAEIAAARVQAEAKFAADWGGLSVAEALRTAVDNAHLFKPVPASRGRGRA